MNYYEVAILKSPLQNLTYQSEEIIENGFTTISASKSLRFSVWLVVVDLTATFIFLFNAFAISVIF